MSLQLSKKVKLLWVSSKKNNTMMNMNTMRVLLHHLQHNFILFFSIKTYSHWTDIEIRIQWNPQCILYLTISKWSSYHVLCDETVRERSLRRMFMFELHYWQIKVSWHNVWYCILLISFRNSKTEQPATYQSNNAQNIREGEISNVYINENNRSEYQELGEFSKTETYDTLQKVAYKNNL